MTVIEKQFKAAFHSATRNRRAPVKVSKKIKSHFQLRNLLNGIDPALAKIESAANFVSNALGKGDIV